MALKINGLGTANPPHSISQTRAAEFARTICCENEEQARLLGVLYRRSVVTRRYSVAIEAPITAEGDSRSESSLEFDRDNASNNHSVGVQSTVEQSLYPPATDPSDRGPTTAERMAFYERCAGPLAVEAATRGIENAGFEPAEITHLITVSCTGFSAPGVDLNLIRECELSPNVARTHIGFMGCHGAINALRVAQSFVDANASAKVLLCAVELCTLHQHYGWYPEQVVSNALFADGAAALVGSAGTEGETRLPSVVATGSTIIPDSTDQMSWLVRDHGFEMSLSALVPSIIEEKLRPWLCEWLAEQGLSPDEVRGWAIHPGGPRILRACEQALNLQRADLSASYDILRRYGNMSSPTVLFILEQLIQTDNALPCVMLAFGPGLSIEAALIR
ncbi:type III polyketide synthase [Rhodopirellula sp. MGV]|uniref:type III polyketide synthase n=1 Tax=Rhodopirellula sp. MGV TaxID=2023130 RepID=UPI000B96746A|nr:type III polyketide synthase [Rhodopirellula sp. MGV]OYP33943.1 chalcone synthase [Rhodopirellula sp. MGV]PNY34076.1 type III polyketide synthase [Rhodopirellula baltica]